MNISDIKIDYEQLRNRCFMTETQYHLEPGFQLFQLEDPLPTKNKLGGWRTSRSDFDYYMFRDSGQDSRVLAVAHLDTVKQIEENRTFQRARLGPNNKKRTHLWNAQLDDRLGAYTILDLLPSLLGGFEYDVLLTTNEECGGSTAGDFTPLTGIQYNWIFQFDRRGTGGVLYNYEDSTWRSVVGKYFTVEQGSYSDICKLEDLGAKAINVGTAYHSEHTDGCFMIVEDYIAQVASFLNMFRELKDTHFPHSRRVYQTWTRKTWDDDVWDYPNFRTGEPWSSALSNKLPDSKVGQAGQDTQPMLPFRTGGNEGSSGLDYITSSDYLLSEPEEWKDYPGILVVKGWKTASDDDGTSASLDDTRSLSYLENPVTHEQVVQCSYCQKWLTIVEDVHKSKVFIDQRDYAIFCDECINPTMSVDNLQHFTHQLPNFALTSKYTNEYLTPDAVTFLQEGGSIKKATHFTRTTLPAGKSNWVRSIVSLPLELAEDGIVKFKYGFCDVCDLPEWREHLKDIAPVPPARHAGAKSRICRFCAAKHNIKTDDGSGI